MFVILQVDSLTNIATTNVSFYILPVYLVLFVKIIVKRDLNKSLILGITLQHVRHPAPYASFDASNHAKKNAVTFLINEAYRGNHPKYPNHYKATQRNNYVCKICTGKI